MITIGLLTNSVISANYGVDALSISNIILIEKSCRKKRINHKYVLFGDASRKEEQINVIKSIQELKDIEILIVPELEFRKLQSAKEFVKNIKNCDIVFDTSGGDSYSDIYGNNRILHQYLPKQIVLQLRKKLILTPQTIGPFESKIWKHLCKKQINSCIAVFARDKKSYDVVKKEFELDNISLVTDMAMILPYKKVNDISKDDNKLNIGINVSGLLYNGGYTGNNQFGLKSNYKLLIDKIIDVLANELKYNVFLIPHVITSGIESDNEACEEIKRLYPNVTYNRVFSGPIEAKSYISSLDLLIGSRMHSTIAAISSGVPVIPLSYSRKFEGLFGSINYDMCINLKEEDENQICDQIKMTIDNMEELNKMVKNSKSIIDKKISLYCDKLDYVLENCEHEK